jgi:hypothetical protein
MWCRASRSVFSEKVNAKSGQTDAIHPVLQTVLIQAHNGPLSLAGKLLNPRDALKPIIDLPVEDRLCPINRCSKRFIQDRRGVLAHRFFAVEYLRSLCSSIPLLSKRDICFCLLRPYRCSGYGKTRDDGMGDLTSAADAPQDLERLSIVVFPVGGVDSQYPRDLTSRTRSGEKQNGKSTTKLFKVIDFPLNV